MYLNVFIRFQRRKAPCLSRLLTGRWTILKQRSQASQNRILLRINGRVFQATAKGVSAAPVSFNGFSISGGGESAGDADGSTDRAGAAFEAAGEGGAPVGWMSRQ
jgi:hypothetical protein